MRVIHIQTIGPRDGRQAVPMTPTKRCPTANKLIFPSEEQALKQLIEWSEHNNWIFDRNDCYLCRHCGFWHLTRNRKEKRDGRDPRIDASQTS